MIQPASMGMVPFGAMTKPERRRAENYIHKLIYGRYGVNDRMKDSFHKAVGESVDEAAAKVKEELGPHQGKYDEREVLPAFSDQFQRTLGTKGFKALHPELMEGVKLSDITRLTKFVGNNGYVQRLMGITNQYADVLRRAYTLITVKVAFPNRVPRDVVMERFNPPTPTPAPANSSNPS